MYRPLTSHNMANIFLVSLILLLFHCIVDKFGEMDTQMNKDERCVITE